ncbi:glycoside hydrolase family 16 protein [Marinilabilia sp.]
MIFWKNLLLLITFGFSVITAGCTQKDKDNLELVWSEEFDYTGLPDETKWNYDTIGNSYGWGNNELQYYTVARGENAYVDGENLIITARKEAWDDFNYTSARLTTQGKGDWLYGRMEIKAVIPGGRGIWPAIWMLPTDWAYGGWPESGEIDIMEHVGYEPDSIYTTVHTGAFNHAIGTEVGKGTYVPRCENSFCVYAIEWRENKIDFFIDDEKVFTFDKRKGGSDVWPFDKRFYMILNVAVGGNWGGLHGVDDDVFPARMLVDYVRVYKFLE